MGQPEADGPRRANRVIVQVSEADEGRAARILFLYSDTGGGHRAAARAIDEALRDLEGAAGMETHHVDAFASCGNFPLREGVASYSTMLKVQPSPYAAIYHLTNGETRVRVLSELGLPFMRRNFRRMLTTLRPNLVVSVHPLLNTPTRRVIQAEHLDATLVTVITDLVTIHHSWTADAAADEYVVASSEAQALCIARGIPESRVHDLGLPIRKCFGRGARNARDAKRELELDLDRRVLLAMGGGEGGGKMRKILAEIAPAIRRHDLQLVVIAGRNDALRKRLDDMAPELGRTPRILGFIENVADYMRAADVLLTKAGPGAIAEAAACGLPVVMYEYISGQEKGNLDFVTSRGSGIVALDAESVIAALDRLFAADGHARSDMSRRALASARPEAAADIARFLLEVLSRRRSLSAVGPPSAP